MSPSADWLVHWLQMLSICDLCAHVRQLMCMCVCVCENGAVSGEIEEEYLRKKNRYCDAVCVSKKRFEHLRTSSKSVE